MDRAELQAFVRKHRKANANFVERKLWDVAESAPLGGSLPGGSELNPYLLRVYVSPRDPQFKWLWLKLTRFARDLGDYDPSLFQGVPHLYLHYFFRGDDDVEVHNHPWLFSVSLILTGGYVEERWEPATKTIRTRHCYPGDINVIRSSDFHRVTLKAPDRGCWTLFLSSNRVGEKNGHEWGFLDTKTEKYTPRGEFVSSRQTPQRAEA
jgi:hypothetical protein